MSGFRPEKVGEQIHKEVTRLLMYNIKDPRVTPVIITGVKVSRDIGSARIYFSVSDEATERKEAERGLKSAAAYIRRELGQVMRLRFIPEIRFEYDDSIGYGQKIDALLRQVQDDLNDSSADC
ncbi:MAG: 30S ribosome-binding factor RbfA [Deltaproteobacteria bacterium]|nr:30S ribosome-binding factor RbfA [Deltaproteobacteria bacterium]